MGTGDPPRRRQAALIAPVAKPATFTVPPRPIAPDARPATVVEPKPLTIRDHDNPDNSDRQPEE